MKSTMREFVMTNKNLLKKFRLTGTNSTMTMLKEVFKDEDPGTVMFGPSCASGPLGGDAELVAHMVSGKIGGVIFFQDPMDAHPHRADIDCLVRQALVHNTMMAETPTSAIMLLQCLRTALMENRAELIPSFFFSLQSPTVEAYKAQQSAVVNMQKQNVHNMMK
jgi:methylglyoxal synthase